jgi:hypothetical protein
MGMEELHESLGGTKNYFLLLWKKLVLGGSLNYIKTSICSL